jgi:integrase/recombinase XerC
MDTCITACRDDFLQFLSVQKNYSENTIRAYHNDLDEFISFVASLKRIDTGKKESMETLLPDHVDGLTIRAYLGDLYKKKNMKSSIGRKLSALRSFFKFLLKIGRAHV